jgi:hypothetical protein
LLKTVLGVFYLFLRGQMLFSVFPGPMGLVALGVDVSKALILAFIMSLSVFSACNTVLACCLQ